MTLFRFGFDRLHDCHLFPHIIQSVLREVRDKEDLRLVAPAKLEDINYDPEKGLQFKAVCEVVPDIELKTYRGLSVEREVYEVDDQDISDALNDVRDHT